jgi:hypothetical protein
MGANQNIEATLGARRAMSADMLGSSANIYNTGGNMRLAGDQAAAGMMEASGNMGLNTATNFLNQNPYTRAMGGLGAGAGMIQSGSDLAANTASFNTNMQASIYNSYLNNQAAMKSARMQAGAANNSATMGMIGTGVGAAAGLAVVGIAI